MMKKVVLVILIATLYFVTAASGAPGWEVDFEAAKKKAAAENKVLLVDFTGSDWCGWCIRLKDEVFTKQEFKDYAKDKFILVELDFPREKQQDPKIKKQNKMLAAKYKIQGYPTILLMDVEGRPFAKTGYQAGGPAAYNKHLENFLDNKSKIDKSFEEASKASEVEKAMKLVAALKYLPEETLEHYTDVMNEIYKLDPDDKTGFKKTQGLSVAIKGLQDKVMGMVSKGEITEAEKYVDDFVKNNSLEGENKQKALFAKLSTYNPQNPSDLEKADKLINEIIAVDANSQMGKQGSMVKSKIAQMKANLKK